MLDLVRDTVFSPSGDVPVQSRERHRLGRGAGVGKAALYRRWSSMPKMASDRLSHVGLEITETGDAGSLKEDLAALLLSIHRVLRHRMIRRILADLHAEIGREPALAETIRPFQQARRHRANTLVERAVACGKLAQDVDRETITELVAAPLYWRFVVLGGRSDRQHIQRLACMIAAAAKAA